MKFNKYEDTTIWLKCEKGDERRKDACLALKRGKGDLA